MKGYLLGLDLGTTNIKGIILSFDGKVVAEENTPVTYEKKEKTVEYDAGRFFMLVSGTIRRLLSGFENPQMIKALSMVSASGNTVLLDNEMLPLRKAINWTDKRFADEADIVLEKPDYRKLYETTGWPFNNTFPLAHLSWLKLNEPEILKSAYKVCMVTDYVNYRLTGNLCTNPSTATTFYLADQAKGIWLDEILDKLGIDKAKLPEILPANAVMGNITAKVAEETGLMENTPVIAGSFDHPGAARATGVLEEGGLLLSCGTSWVGFYPSNSRETLVSLEMLVDPFLKDRGIWGGMFSLPRIGNNIDYLIRKWVDDSEGMYKTFNEMAEASPPGANGLSINPMEDIKRDLSRYGKPEISRALMEGTAKLMKKQMDYFSGCGLKNNRIVMAGGPTQSTLWMKILNDILDADISIAGSHAGAKGAAIMAGIGIGTYKDEFDAFRKINGG